jgi:hypothetical protein
VGGTGGTTPCPPPDGNTCQTASWYCPNYPYMPGQYVVAVCTVNTGGCMVDYGMLFRCVASCGEQIPGGSGYTNASHGSINGQCGIVAAE